MISTMHEISGSSNRRQRWYLTWLTLKVEHVRRKFQRVTTWPNKSIIKEEATAKSKAEHYFLMKVLGRFAHV